MIQYHPAPLRPVTTNGAGRTVFSCAAGDYRLFRQGDGCYVNGPFGYLRCYHSAVTPEMITGDIEAALRKRRA